MIPIQEYSDEEVLDLKGVASLMLNLFLQGIIWAWWTIISGKKYLPY